MASFICAIWSLRHFDRLSASLRSVTSGVVSLSDLYLIL